ncbi:MAG TPA: group 1 truncated hemoglobin [Cellvibrionaceae bacterium]|nr:group 1 truncated hemoglobin [Cellvibrionaceae bacterium]HMW47378.1 group 1 truncated hemoglobin [Cellvibrionaceae bacterium]HMW73472.1 group 1 truncated hemoglobin [Cellvibrionaceae bacterium]HMY41278.1 group 1 truncated hemoglobin [Marinagarivorans sp.]HNG61286.1 group 1 truncated hemoglobin [Cellvibrionaceae bacterium]
MSLFERIGGAPAVDAAVNIFYRKVLGDERISHFFESVDMERQAAKQKAFLTMVFGGPNQYTGLDMRKAHAGMHLTEEHFDAVVQHLGSTLTQLGVAADDIAQIAALAQSVKADVLNQ